MLKVYGIKNCDTCRKAVRFLDAANVQYQFIDLRETPPQPGQVKAWLAILGEERLLNRRSTTWRNLDDTVKVAPGVLTQQHLVALLVEHPTLVKRPLFVNGANMLIGFKPDLLQEWLDQEEE